MFLQGSYPVKTALRKICDIASQSRGVMVSTLDFESNEGFKSWRDLKFPLFLPTGGRDLLDSLSMPYFLPPSSHRGLHFGLAATNFLALELFSCTGTVVGRLESTAGLGLFI